VRKTEYRGKPIDVWSLGVVLYAMLVGCFPFAARSYPELYKRIMRGAFRLPDTLSHGAKDLLRNMLCVDPARRYTIQPVRNHSWLRSERGVDLQVCGCAKYSISEDPREDLVDDLVRRLCSFGIGREAVVDAVMSKARNAVATTYYLLFGATEVRKHKRLAEAAYASGRV